MLNFNNLKSVTHL